ncbi:MAG: hypothetical protein WDN04_04630 [Rhodospirillales bacterium]
MPADAPDPVTIAPRRVPLRRQLGAAPGGHADAATLQFHAAANLACGDRDVLTGYQLFLGRDPENSFVIADNKANSVRGFIIGLLASTEFHGAVIAPMQRGQAMPHERTSLGPTAAQAAWITDVLVMPAPVAAALLAAPTWRAFFTALAGVPGVSLAPPPAEPARTSEVAPSDAEEGFLLISVDQPKPGERLHPGALISGNGWAIAGTDIVEVAVWLDDSQLTLARYGLPRPDVARNFPHYRHVDHCGFAFSAQVPQDTVLTRHSQLVVVVRTASGQIGRKGVRIEPPPQAAAAATTAPAQWPIRLFVEDVRVDAAATLRLRGWAVSRAKLASVNVFLAETLLGSAETGLSRPDIAATHGEYPNAPQSGFVFTADLRGHPAGPYALRVQVTDDEGMQRQSIVPITVPAIAAPAVPAEAPVTPRAEAAAPAAAPEAPAAAEPPETVRFSCDGALFDAGGHAARQRLGGGRRRHRRHRRAARRGNARPGRARRQPPRRGARAEKNRPGAATSGFRLLARPTEALSARHHADPAPAHHDGRHAFRSTSPSKPTRETAAPPPPPTEGMRLEIDRPALHGAAAAAPVRGTLSIDGLGRRALRHRRRDRAVRRQENRRRLCRPPARGHRAPRSRIASIRCAPASRWCCRPAPSPKASAASRSSPPAATASTTEQSFSVRVEPPDTVLPGSTPRTRMPRAEQDFSETLLATLGLRPRFCILVHVAPLRAGRPGALDATLASLASQVYGDFTTTLLLPTASQERTAAATVRRDFPELAGRLSTTTARGRPPPTPRGTASRPGAVHDAVRR